MKLGTLFVAALLMALAVQPAISAPSRHRVAATRDWSSTATVAPGGAFVLGNPNARVRLIEYASYTCPHCAAFAAEGWPALRPYIHSGRLALEFRTAVRDRFDIVAAMLARCQGPAPFFPASEAIFAGQADWTAKAAAWEQTPASDLSALPPTDALVALAKAAGFDAMLAPRGLTPVAMRTCLADPKTQQPIAAMSDEAWQQRKISGTPAFVINDVAIDVHNWAGLKPFVDDAVK